MLGHLHSGKDHATLLRAWQLVVEGVVAAGKRAPVLLLAGREAGTHHAVKALAYDLGLRDRVRFLGEVADITGLLEASDFGVFSSRSEALGRGATEPMYAGLAVAATDVPGIREAVGAPGLPFLSAPGDSGSLAATILRLARDSDLRSRVGRENAELIRERQSAKETTAVYAELVARALSGRRRGLALEAALAVTQAAS